MSYSTEKQRDYQRQWIAARRTDYMQGKSCVQCGSAESLEVDHIDPAQKVSHRIWSWSIERRNVELAKCQILCKECHLVKTVSSYAEIPHGTVSRYSSKRYKCRCEDCRKANRDRTALHRARKKAALAPIADVVQMPARQPEREAA